MEPLFQEYPNTVFRFRQYNSWVLKELLYGELFFTTKDELNDPYDTKSSALYQSNFEIYKRFVGYMFGSMKIPGVQIQNIDCEAIAKFLSQKNLLQDELIDLIGSNSFLVITKKAVSKIRIENFALLFINWIKTYIHRAAGLGYIASFSKNNKDPVMWSHYSNSHKGFCLCFSIDNSILKADRLFKSDHFFGECKFEEVIYDYKNVTSNAFYFFPKAVFGQGITEEERLNFWKLRKKSYLTKYTSWQYEQEVRIVLDDWFDPRTSTEGVIKRQIVDRMFYYDQKQLTGIIFGAKMGENEREEIRSIILKLRRDLLERDSLLDKGSYLPLFTFYEAKENSEEFQMNIEPINALDTMNKTFSILEFPKKKEEYENLRRFYEMRKSKS